MKIARRSNHLIEITKLRTQTIRFAGNHARTTEKYLFRSILDNVVVRVHCSSSKTIPVMIYSSERSFLESSECFFDRRPSI